MSTDEFLALSVAEQTAYRRHLNALPSPTAELTAMRDCRGWREKLREDLENVRSGGDGLFGYPTHLIDWQNLESALHEPRR